MQEGKSFQATRFQRALVAYFSDLSENSSLVRKGSNQYSFPRLLHQCFELRKRTVVSRQPQSISQEFLRVPLRYSGRGAFFCELSLISLRRPSKRKWGTNGRAQLTKKFGSRPRGRKVFEVLSCGFQAGIRFCRKCREGLPALRPFWELRSARRTA